MAADETDGYVPDSPDGTEDTVEDMIMSEEPDEWVPITENPQVIVDHARNENLAVECKGAAGVTHSFTYTGVDDLWAGIRSNMDTSFIIEFGRDDTIERCIESCVPDVRLVTEQASDFRPDVGNGEVNTGP